MAISICCHFNENSNISESIKEVLFFQHYLEVFYLYNGPNIVGLGISLPVKFNENIWEEFLMITIALKDHKLIELYSNIEFDVDIAESTLREKLYA